MCYFNKHLPTDNLATDREQRSVSLIPIRRTTSVHPQWLQRLPVAVVFFVFAIIAHADQAFCQFTDLPILESKSTSGKSKSEKSTTPTVRPVELKTAKEKDKGKLVKMIGDSGQNKTRAPAKIEKFNSAFQIPHGKPKIDSDRTAEQEIRTPIAAEPKTGVNPVNRNSNFVGPGKVSSKTTEPRISSLPKVTEQKIYEPKIWKPAVVQRTTSANRTVHGVTIPGPQDDQYQPWWQQQLTQKALGKNKDLAYMISVDQLVLAMLQHSPEIRALQQEPAIASTYIDVESAKFDPIAFLEAKWEDTNEPVGNILTTNNSPFLKDHVVTTKGGFRKRTHIGTEVELGQNLGFKNSNSEFFLPQDQGTARLVLNIDQPLLNGAGRMVGTSRIVLAQIDTGISESQYAEKLQEKILAVVRAYWEFYYQKSVLILRKQNYDAAVEILRQLKGRESFDAQRSQIIRAEAAVAARKLDLIRSRTDVRNAETVLRELTRDPRLGKLGIANPVELIPTEFPVVDDSIYPDLSAVVTVAFHNRPEIDQAMQKIRAASVQYDVSKNQLLPQLNLIFNTYTAALNGETEILEAWNRQFVDSTPGYSAGIVLEYPIYNRAALARKRRVEAQLTKLSSELDDTLGSISAEVEIAHRELRMALEATAESKASVDAAQKDEAFIQKRWKNFAFLQNPEFASPTIYLEQLLDAQDRIAQAQAQYANATRQFMVAVAELRKAEGSLLNYEALAPTETLSGESNLPEIRSDSDINQFRQ